MVLYDPHAPGKGLFRSYLATRPVTERVVRERLLKAHGNVRFHWGTQASHLQHRTGEKAGWVTGGSRQNRQPGLDAAASESDFHVLLQQSGLQSKMECGVFLSPKFCSCSHETGQEFDL